MNLFNRRFSIDIIWQKLPPIGRHVVGQDYLFSFLSNRFQMRYAERYRVLKKKPTSQEEISGGFKK